MQTKDFTYSLPNTHIATHPANPRESARLLHIDGNTRHDYTIADLPQQLSNNDVLVVNNTKVIPVQIYGTKGEANIALTLLKATIQHTEHTIWQAMAKPAKKLQAGDCVIVADTTLIVEEKQSDGSVLLRLPFDYATCIIWLETHGHMPLPPYILKQRGGRATVQDHEDYQTLFATYQGAVAAPTASLHFTPQLMQQLHAKQIEIIEITLHVGAGTFLPVKTEHVDDHVMHHEWLEITEEAASRINAARQAGKRITAIGTTALRALEAATDTANITHPMQGETNIFITPGYVFHGVDRLLTNFHLPESTLLMLVCAFAGTEAIFQAYAHAIDHNYRFYSYGDACLLERA